MESFILNNMEFDIPSSFAEITMKQYCDIFYDLLPTDSEDEGLNINNMLKNNISIISKLTNLSEEDIYNLPIGLYNKLQDSIKWIYTIQPELIKNQVILNGREYMVTPPSEFNLRQYIDMDKTITDKGNKLMYLELLAIILNEKGKKYDGKYEERLLQLENISAQEGLGMIFFLLKRGMILKNLSKHYSILQSIKNPLAPITGNS